MLTLNPETKCACSPLHAWPALRASVNQQKSKQPPTLHGAGPLPCLGLGEGESKSSRMLAPYVFHALLCWNHNQRAVLLPSLLSCCYLIQDLCCSPLRREMVHIAEKEKENSQNKDICYCLSLGLSKTSVPGYRLSKNLKCSVIKIAIYPFQENITKKFQYRIEKKTHWASDMLGLKQKGLLWYVSSVIYEGKQQFHCIHTLYVWRAYTLIRE